MDALSMSLIEPGSARHPLDVKRPHNRWKKGTQLT